MDSMLPHMSRVDMVRVAIQTRGKLEVGDLDLGFICQPHWVEDVTGEGGRERGGGAAADGSGAPKWGRRLGIFLVPCGSGGCGSRRRQEHTQGVALALGSSVGFPLIFFFFS